MKKRKITAILIFIFLITTIVIIADLLTKYLAFNQITPGKGIFIGLGDHLVLYAYINHRSISYWHMTIFVACSVWSILSCYYYHQLNHFLNLGLGLILGGATGNFYDSIFYGGVRDFISIKVSKPHYYAVTNIADIAILFGEVALFVFIFSHLERAVINKPPV